MFFSKRRGDVNPIGKAVFIILVLVEVIFIYIRIPPFEADRPPGMGLAYYTIEICFWALIGVMVAALISRSLRTADQWEKAVVLRMGRFRGLKGPGFFMIIPIIERVDQYIDQRVRVVNFGAEKTLTQDTVPVDVDAVAYWTVWDAEKTALEVQEYENAVSYAAQTGLRDIIGKHELADLLQKDCLMVSIQPLPIPLCGICAQPAR